MTMAITYDYNYNNDNDCTLFTVHQKKQTWKTR